ncbi:MAG: penicillin-insensitive murein endopeptidase [Myxococcales bacterium]|nr:penicillin-insensitive murein endopeptidase [Myxococcales bacterium]
MAAHVASALLFGLVVMAVPGVAAAGTPTWDLFGLERPAGLAEVRIVKPNAADVFPYLTGEPEGRSFSIGTVTEGRIVNAARLVFPGRTYGVLARQLRRDLVYGGDELVAAIVAASEYVDRVYPGSILWLGNVGRRGGGDIPYSVSHNNGRDADLAFYTVDPSGRLVQPPDLLHYRGDGRTREFGGYYRFDDARNWALAKSLALSRFAQVQYLFISNPLRARLLDYARRTGEPAAVIARVSALMSQPGVDNPHDDHLHVRVHCGAADLTAGCEELGRALPGTDRFSNARALRVDAAVALLHAEDAELRRRAIARLAMIGGRGQLRALQGALDDPSPVVRAEAVDALAALGGESQTAWLVTHWEDEDDDLARDAIVRAVGRLGGAAAGQFLSSLLAAPRPVVVRGVSYDLRVSVADAVAVSERAEAAYPLAELVGAPDPELRSRALAALRVLTNAELVAADVSQPLDEEQRAAAAEACRAWVDAAAHGTRGSWLWAGFEAEGAPEDGRAVDVAAALARLTGDPRPWLRENAERTLRQMTGNAVVTRAWSASDRRAYWTRWVRRNAGSIRSVR